MQHWRGWRLLFAVVGLSCALPSYSTEDKVDSETLLGIPEKEKEEKYIPENRGASRKFHLPQPSLEIPKREAPADPPPATDEEETKAIEQKKDMFEKTHGVPLTNDLGEIDYENVNNFSPNEFSDGSTGNPNQAGPIPESCKTHQSKNPNGITFVQPATVGETGAVLFGGQACAGVKRRDGNFNNWPSEALNGTTKMTPDGVNGKSSANYKKGSYGSSTDPNLKPIWLGNSGSVQIHSLNSLGGNKSLAGISSMGCLVVNQNCMAALNAFLNNSPDLKFSIVGSSPTNTDCTKEVNKSNPNI